MKAFKRLWLALAGLALIMTGHIDLARAQAVIPDGSVVQGHLTVSQAPGIVAAPTGTSCTVSAGSTDMAGACAATATSAVAIAFAKAFATKPWCVVLDHTTASGSALANEPSTTGFTMGTTVSGDKITWICLGVPGN